MIWIFIWNTYSAGQYRLFRRALRKRMCIYCVLLCMEWDALNPCLVLMRVLAYLYRYVLKIKGKRKKNSILCTVDPSCREEARGSVWRVGIEAGKIMRRTKSYTFYARVISGLRIKFREALFRYKDGDCSGLKNSAQKGLWEGHFLPDGELVAPHVYHAAHAQNCYVAERSRHCCCASGRGGGEGR